MRTFPRKWVFPGGHVDSGETLEQAAIREAKEETGLNVKIIKPLAMWESCFPTYLEQGIPSRQHIVFYFIAELIQPSVLPNWSQITPEIEETDCVVWIPICKIPSLLERDEPQYTIDALKVVHSGEEVKRIVKKKSFLKLQPKSKEEDLRSCEGISMGTSFIMQCLLETAQ